MSGATELDAAGEALVARFEGGQSSDGLYRAYWDAYGKKETIGIGQTHYKGGDVPVGLVWTREQAYDDLRTAFASNYAWAINDLGVEFNQNQFNALADYIWNCGPGSIVDYGLAPYLKREDWAGAAELLLRPDTAGGVYLPGLGTRRQTEKVLFLTPCAPATPPDPYLIYPTAEMEYHKHVFHERRLAGDVDLWLKHVEHDPVNREHLKHALPLMKAAASRIWLVSVYANPGFTEKREKPDWKSDDRGVRYQAWGKRIHAAEKVLGE